MKKRILVVDDDLMSREGVGELLADEGYAVAVAADGQQAIDVLPSFQPDLVLTDLQMPKLDGLGVLDHVKHVSPATPVIIVTADLSLDSMCNAQRLGVWSYIHKPLDFADLLARVSGALMAAV